ncbi:unnamed protein product [Ambrosiozyma monospora]|uniref:Unnamed protein product n=1 Tax=Ambrosiozyma monospora TaxID=43982 RepID=A0ACB5SZE4_AMBMO|nr:unnamed protein product [Ambrosiozyma monospora]
MTVLWTPEEDELLYVITESRGVYDFEVVARAFNGKTPDDCKDRYWVLMNEEFDIIEGKKEWNEIDGFK